MYSIHSSIFSKCGFIMRPVLINEDDDALFNASFSTRVAVTYQNHIKEIRRMVKQQSVGFWIRFVTSFRSHNEQHRLMDGIVFPRAEAVFVDMLHLLTCGDNLNELTRLVASLRAMQAAIIANDYHVLLNPVLRILMTCYDKPLDGLRLYFRFVAGMVVMFRRWRQVAWRSKKDSETMLPWEPPSHWQEMTNRDYSEWTFEGHLLCVYGAELPQLLALPPGLPCWMPDELKTGHLFYSTVPMEEIPGLQDANARGNRNRKKSGRRRKSRQFDEEFSGCEPYAITAAPSPGDSGVCLIELGPDAVATEPVELLKSVTTGNITGSYSNACTEESAILLEKDPAAAVMIEPDSLNVCTGLNGDLSAEVPQNCELFADSDKSSAPEHIALNPHDDVLPENLSPERSMEIVYGNKEKESEQDDDHAAATFMKDTDEYNEENFSTSYINDGDYGMIPANFCGDWKKCSCYCEEQQFGNCYCNRTCQSLDWKFRHHTEHSVLSRLREAGAGDSIAQNMQYYVWTNDCPTDEEQPGVVQSDQCIHPGGLPVPEQNYGTPYDQCLHIYRRDGPPRIMLGANNFQANCQVEEMPHLGRPNPWMESPANFAHTSPIGYFDPPVMDYMGPPLDMRRRGPQNRRIRQRRGRQPSGLATIEESFATSTVDETQTSVNASTSVQNEAMSSSYQKKQWHSKRNPGSTETLTEEATIEDLTNSKTSVTDDAVNDPPSLETDLNISTGTSPHESCTKGYALAVCGLLGKRSGKTSETRKEVNKQEESSKETVVNKLAPCDKPNFKKCKGKQGKQLEERGSEILGKSPVTKDIVKDTDKFKRFTVKPETNNVSVSDSGRTKMNKGKMINKTNMPVEAGKGDKPSMDCENNNTMPYLSKNSKSRVEIARNNVPFQDEKVTERKRKWKNVWTRRRESETHRPEVKSTTENNVQREREVNKRHDPDRRDGVPENVPDILKQIENSELKSFWKESYQAPKPQRKSRPRRDTKWRQGIQECTTGAEFCQSTKKDDVTPIVTPVVKLDIVPAVEPKDKENFPQDTSVHEQSIPQSSSSNCVSEIGWYEETLAEDKDREDHREVGVTDAREGRNMCSARKNKNRKNKRKQRFNRRAKDERNGVESFIKYNDNMNKIGTETSQDVTQSKSSSDGSNEERLNNPELLINNLQEGAINENTPSEVRANQKEEELIGTSLSTNSDNKSTAEKMKNNHTQDTHNESSNKNEDSCKTILQEILLHCPENPENLKAEDKMSEETLLTEMYTFKEKVPEENINNCKSIKEEVVPSENVKNYPEKGIVREQSSSTGYGMKEHEKKNNEEDHEHAAWKIAGCKIKENEAIVIHRKRQACLARTLKCLAGFKFNIPLPTKRHFLKFFFINGEILKAIENLPKKRIFISGPGCPFSSGFPRSTGRAFGVPQPPPNKPRRKLLLRRCDNCNILEKTLGEYGECVRCKEIPTRLPRVYCDRMCQRADWKRRHCAEHKHDSEENCRGNDNCAFI